MPWDWQELAALTLVALAILSLARRARRLFARSPAAGGCGTGGCGSCPAARTGQRKGSPENLVSIETLISPRR